MAYRVIIVPVLGESADSAALACTRAITERARGHIVGLHVRNPISMVMTGGMFEGAYMSPDLINGLEESGRSRAAAARDVFRQWQQACGIESASAPDQAKITAEWVELEAPVAAEIGRRGRTADLVVLARSARDFTTTTDEALQGALFDSGRPVLIVPGSQTVNLVDTVVIAWNDSREAAHAVAAAWSLIGHAKRIVVFVGGNDEGMRRSADRLVTHLAWRGYAAATVIGDASGDVGDGLLTVAQREKAGLIVMGAYTHSRLRQIVFGGATSHILKNTTIPVLMAH
ncbi:MAG TPA: universal stress protein [Vineibacter sp.]|nr:universal stress protein [Vineibacter sp.]